MKNTDTNQVEQLNETAVMQSVFAHQLRVGNLISYNGIICKISDIKSPKPFCNNEYYSNEFIIGVFNGSEVIECKITDIKPLFINENLLKKGGFSNVEYIKEIDCNVYSNWDNSSIQIQFPIGVEAHVYLGNYPIAIRYAHQLQNLYFELKKTDLTVA